jgi:hypothetical protein
MSRSSKSAYLSSRLTVDVVMQYEILPPEEDIPLQIDITALYLNLVTPNPEKFRRINILNAISESEIINLEDEILTQIGELP